MSADSGNGNVIRKEDTSGVTPIPFQFSDVQALAKKILQRAADQAQRKLMAAEQQAQDIEKVAYDDGMKRGLADGTPRGEAEGRKAGDAAAREEFAARTGGVAAVLEELLRTLEENKQKLQADAESDLLRLAVGIARLVVRREIALDSAYVMPTVRDAIRACSERTDLRMHVHPDDCAAIEAELPHLHAMFTDLGRVTICPDETVERGGVRLLGRATEVDMRIGEQFKMIERALLGDVLEPDGMFTSEGTSPAAGVAQPPSAPEVGVHPVEEAGDVMQALPPEDEDTMSSVPPLAPDVPDEPDALPDAEGDPEDPDDFLAST